LSLLVLTLAALFCLGVGVVLATILLVVTFWDTHRLLVLGCSPDSFWQLASRHGCRHAQGENKAETICNESVELFKDRQQLVSSYKRLL